MPVLDRSCVAVAPPHQPCRTVSDCNAAQITKDPNFVGLIIGQVVVVALVADIGGSNDVFRWRFLRTQSASDKKLGLVANVVFGVDPANPVIPADNRVIAELPGVRIVPAVIPGTAL
jgi:hypothetical protein